MRLRAASPSVARRVSSRNRSSMAQVSAAVSPLGTSRPEPPPSSSGTPPTAVAITGTPAAMASISATGMPSCVLARITASITPR